MWLTIFTTLLLSTICAGANTRVHFAIKELHNQVSPIAKTANDLFLESELLNGKVDLVKEVLGDNLQMFEEYSQMDISSGIPEQNEVLELVEKAETSRKSDETRKKIENGFETMEDIKDFQFGNDNFSRIPDELKKIETSSHLYKTDTFYKGRNIVQKVYDTYFKGPEELDKELSAFEKYIEGLSIEPLSFDPIEVLKSSIAELQPMIEKIKTLETLSEDLTSMETEMKVLEELRESKAPKEIQTLTKKLENTVNQILVTENVESKYQKIETASKLLERISLFTSFLSTIKWKFEYLKKQWSPVEKYLSNLKIPSEDLSKPFAGLQDCISQQDFSMYSSLHEEELNNATEQFRKLHSLRTEFKESFDRLLKSKETGNFDHSTLRTKNDWPVMPGEYMSFYEALIMEMDQVTKAIDVQAVTKFTEHVKLVIDKIDQFSKCYSELKVTPESVKSLMDQSLKAWNFDPRPLESVVAVIDLFKDAHKMLGGLTSWKFEQNDFIKSFPLTSEDVTGISEGVGVLEAIMKVQSGWDIMRESMEDSDVKDALAKFSEELSHLEMDANLPKIQELLSNVQFPNNFDAVIDFYKNRYQGSRRRDILKILEVFKTLDFPSYPSKLEKMNQAIGTMRKWAGDQEKLGDQDDEKPWIDCAMSACDNVLKLPETPEDPVPEVSL